MTIFETNAWNHQSVYMPDTTSTLEFDLLTSTSISSTIFIRFG